MAFGLDLAPTLDVLKGNCILAKDDLDRLYVEVTRAVELRSAGLLKINRVTSRQRWKRWARQQQQLRESGRDASIWTLDPVAMVDDRGRFSFHRVSFIHWTAYDYLTTTDHGRNIVSHSSQSKGASALLVARSFLAHLRYTEKCRPNEPLKSFHKWPPQC